MRGQDLYKILGYPIRTIPMDTDTIHNLPIELRREIYRYVPQKKCIMCKGMVVNYNQNIDHCVCSPQCIVRFNVVMTRDVVVHRGAVVVCNIIAIGNFFLLKTCILAVMSGVFIVYGWVGLYVVTNTGRLGWWGLQAMVTPVTSLFV